MDDDESDPDVHRDFHDVHHDLASDAKKNFSENNAVDPKDVVVIAVHGDVVLNVLFSSTRSLTSSPKKTRQPKQSKQANPSSPTRSAFRVDKAALQQHSRYFANLLADTRFHEARHIEAVLADLRLNNQTPRDVTVEKLPWVAIEEESRPGGRSALEELLRILHGPTATAETPEPKIPGKRTVKSTETTLSKLPSKSPAKAKPTIKQANKTAARPAVKPPSKVATKATPTPTEAETIAAPAPPPPPPPTLLQLSILAQLADRFDCRAAVAAHVRTLHPKSPRAVVRPLRETERFYTPAGRNVPVLVNEEAVRQKIYVSWLLDLPTRFQPATGELVLYGSRRWLEDLVVTEDGHDGIAPETEADEDYDDPWWDLPDGIEIELQTRRAAVLACLGSIPRHFLGLYTARHRRQCPMFYESSAACDSFQLGEMVRFLVSRGLLGLTDFAACALPSALLVADVHHIVELLRQCPAYQLDKNHVRCGLRARLLPAVDFVQRHLRDAATVGLRARSWAEPDRGGTSWESSSNSSSAPRSRITATGGRSNDAPCPNDDIAREVAAAAAGEIGWDAVGNDTPDSFRNVPDFGKAIGRDGRDGHGVAVPQERIFRLTRGTYGDGLLGAEARMAQRLFTATAWNWTPEQ